jgi:hypothetical protein
MYGTVGAQVGALRTVFFLCAVSWRCLIFCIPGVALVRKFQADSLIGRRANDEVVRLVGGLVSGPGPQAPRVASVSTAIDPLAMPGVPSSSLLSPAAAPYRACRIE